MCNADNKIGNKGAKAIGDALAPRQNPDGSWVYNEGLTALYLYSKSHPLRFCGAFLSVSVDSRTHNSTGL